MTMTICGECRKPVSSEAASCPHCGAPLARFQPVAKPASSGKTWAIIGGVLVVLYGLYALGSSTDARAPASQQVTQTSAAVPATMTAPDPPVPAPPPPPTHNYTYAENGLFGYSPALSAEAIGQGRATQPLLMIRYNGRRGDTYSFSKPESPLPTMTCTEPCQVMKILVYSDGGLHVEYVPISPDSVLAAMLEDARRGMLDPPPPPPPPQRDATESTQPPGQAPSTTEVPIRPAEEVPNQSGSSEASQPTSEQSAPAVTAAALPQRDTDRPPRAWSPSFNCERASTDVERTICGSSELSALDVAMAGAYAAALERATDKATIRSQQAAWRTTSRDRCQGVECLRAAYRQRVADLQP